jgi:hypothetical protein
MMLPRFRVAGIIINCARLLQGSHDGDNSGFYFGMELQAWNLYRLPLSGAICQCRQTIAYDAKAVRNAAAACCTAFLP